MPKLFGKKGLVICNQNKFLRSLAPSLARARQENKVELFFERLFVLWFDRFPEDEDGLEDDPDHLAWLISRRKKVSPLISI